MKKNKGFTLIELLAVITILGLIALITVPTVSSAINKSKEKTFKTSTENLINAAAAQCRVEQLDGIEQDKTYTFTDGTVDKELDASKGLPKSGSITVDKNCNVYGSVNNGSFCAVKYEDSDEIEIGEMVDGSCEISNDFIKKDTSLYSYFISKDGFLVDEDTIVGYDGSNTNIVIPEQVEGTAYYYDYDMDACVAILKDLNPELTLDRDSFENLCKFALLVEIGFSGVGAVEEFVLEGIAVRKDGYREIQNYKFDESECVSGFRNLLSTAGYSDSEEIIDTLCDKEYYDSGMLPGIDYFGILYDVGAITGELKEHNGTYQLTSEQIESIGYSAFGSKNITSVDFSQNPYISYIGDDAFASNQISGELDFSKLTNLEYIGGDAFGNNQITSVKIPNSVTTIGSYAFGNNSTLTSIEIDNTSDSILGAPWGATNATVTYLR